MSKSDQDHKDQQPSDLNDPRNFKTNRIGQRWANYQVERIKERAKNITDQLNAHVRVTREDGREIIALKVFTAKQTLYFGELISNQGSYANLTDDSFDSEENYVPDLAEAFHLISLIINTLSIPVTIGKFK